MNKQICPWNTSPQTVEEMLDTCFKLLAWEREHGESCPRLWCPMIPTKLMADICSRLVFMEREVHSR